MQIWSLTSRSSNSRAGDKTKTAVGKAAEDAPRSSAQVRPCFGLCAKPGGGGGICVRTRAVAEGQNMSVCGGFPGEIVGCSNFSGNSMCPGLGLRYRIPRLASPRALCSCRPQRAGMIYLMGESGVQKRKPGQGDSAALGWVTAFCPSRV